MKRSLFVLLATVVAACGTRPSAIHGIANVPGVSGTMSAQEAGNATYRYAFSAQVLNERTGDALKQFAVSFLGQDTANGTVVNPLGDLNGMFHVSRTPTSNDAASTLMQVLVTAPGFAPVVQSVDVGADCTGSQCAGQKPLTILLKTLSTVAATKTPAKPAAFDPSTVTQLLDTKGAGDVFSALVGTGKIDPALQALLKKSNNNDVLTNVLVMLNGSSGSQTTALVTQLLSGISADKTKGLGNVTSMMSTMLPMLVQSNPEVAAALVAVNQILPYLQPIVSGQGTKPSAASLMPLLAGLLGGKDPSGSMGTLLTQLMQGQGGSSSGAQLAMTTLLPLLQGLVPANGTKPSLQNPLEGLLGSLLKDGNMLSLLSGLGKKPSTGSADMQMMLTYLQPLIQALGGKNAGEMATLFNLLVKKDGVVALKNFPAILEGDERFAKIAPFLDPVVRGLNSQDATKLATTLLPLLDKKNPAAAVRGLLTKGISAGNPNLSTLVGSLYPALSPLLKESVPGKQVFAAQLLQGLINGDLKTVNVTGDMSGNSSVVVAATARDLLKLAQLPNVDKLLSATAR